MLQYPISHVREIVIHLTSECNSVSFTSILVRVFNNCTVHLHTHTGQEVGINIHSFSYRVTHKGEGEILKDIPIVTNINIHHYIKQSSHDRSHDTRINNSPIMSSTNFDLRLGRNNGCLAHERARSKVTQPSSSTPSVLIACALLPCTVGVVYYRWVWFDTNLAQSSK